MKEEKLVKRKTDSRPFSDPVYGVLGKTGGRFPRVALVMPVGRGSLTMTLACITTLYRTTAYPNWTLVIIDDDAGEELGTFLESVPESVLIRNQRRRSFAQNTNAGFRAVEADYSVLFSNDVLVYDPYWLHKMAALAESNPKIAVVGAGINSCGSFWYVDSGGTARPFHYYHVKFFGRKPFECQSVSGFNMMVKTTVMKEIGLLDEGFYPAYGEETDFCFRSVARGYRVMDCLLPVYHVVRGGWRGKVGFQVRDRVRYSNDALTGSARRLALRWGAMLPSFPAPTYREAVDALRLLAAAPRLLPPQPDLPPTCSPEGVLNPLYELLPATPAPIPFSWRRWWTNGLIQAGRACKLGELFLRGRYDPKDWEAPSTGSVLNLQQKGRSW